MVKLAEKSDLISRSINLDSIICFFTGHKLLSAANKKLMNVKDENLVIIKSTILTSYQKFGLS
jgi:hypothetical protein